MRHPNIPPLITIDEAAQLLAMSVEEIEHAVYVGSVPTAVHRGLVYIDGCALLADFGIWPERVSYDDKNQPARGGPS